MLRRTARSKALQALFAVDVGGLEPEKTLDYVLEGEDLPQKAISFARDLVLGTVAQQGELDAIIEKYVRGWRLERLAAVDRNILRMALFEMKNHPETPVNVVINEAVELAKTFNDEEAGRFVNALLDNARQELGR
ncbi:MAG TPA: transcription antitermination factor NusB [Moorella mulderi]|nr:transcription antitermination factor NusB [Moorella mulderi]